MSKRKVQNICTGIDDFISEHLLPELGLCVLAYLAPNIALQYTDGTVEYFHFLQLQKRMILCNISGEVCASDNQLLDKTLHPDLPQESYVVYFAPIQTNNIFIGYDNYGECDLRYLYDTVDHTIAPVAMPENILITYTKCTATETHLIAWFRTNVGGCFMEYEPSARKWNWVVSTNLAFTDDESLNIHLFANWKWIILAHGRVLHIYNRITTSLNTTMLDMCCPRVMLRNAVIIEDELVYFSPFKRVRGSDSLVIRFDLVNYLYTPRSHICGKGQMALTKVLTY